MADEIKATPRGFISGLFSDVLGRTLNMPSLPRTGIPSLDLLYANRNSLFNMAGVGDVQKTAERISYGQPLTTGSGMTLRPREETIGAALTVAPFAPVVGRVAGRMIKATEGMPVGMGIKDVSPKIGINVNQGGSSFADKIISGEKKFETRESDSLRSYVGKRVGIIRTGEGKAKAIGDVTLGEPIVVSSPEEFAKLRDLHLVPEGSKFDIKQGGVKYLYPIENPVPYGVEKDVAKYGIVSRKILGEPDTLEKALYPQQSALDLAQQRAALPVEQGGLGLPANNTPEMRAAAMGVQTDAYHGSKQDITGLFKAGYDDNLAFVTQSPEFASKWIGKGKLQSRIGAEDEIKAAEDLYREIKYRNTDNELLSKLQGEEFNAAYDKMSANARAEQQKEFGLRGNASGIHDTVYPVKVQANKIFNPETDMDVMSDFFKQNDIPPKLQELYAGGNYMMYETKPVVEYLKSKGYDSMRLRESTGDNYPTIAVFNPETVRSRFAAFDPFRKDVATATAMGVALPDLLAQPVNQYEPTYETIPMYTDPFGNTIGSSIR